MAQEQSGNFVNQTGGGKSLWRTSLFGVFVASLVLMLGGSLTASWIQSGQGSVQVKEVSYLGADNALNNAYLFIPNGVTAKTPAPAIMTVHGFNNSKEYMANTALELARRGYVVLDIDMESHGHSEVAAAGDGGIGSVDGLNYLTSLSIVDKTKVGAVGMSMGGVAIDLAAAAKPNALKSMFFMDSTCAYSCATKINQAETVGTLTEFTVWQSGGNGTAPVFNDILSSKLLEGWASTTSPIVSGKLYGAVADGTAREFWSHFGEHATSTDSPEAIGDAISWFGLTLPTSSSISSSDQIWPIKDLGTGAALVGFLLFVLSLGGLLLRSRAFAGLAEAMPVYKGNTGPRWWIFAIITAALGPVLFNWAFTTGYTGNWFNWEGVTTGFAYWLAVLAIITAVILTVFHFLLGRKAGMTLANYGLTSEGKGFEWRKIVLSALLPLAVLSVAYAILWAVNSALKVDFRFWVVTLKTSDLGHVPMAIVYTIPFAAYFIAASTALHGTLRPKNGTASMRREMLTNILILLVGAIGLLVAYYGPIAFLNASPFQSPSLGWDVGIINFIGTLLILPAVAAVMTYFFRKTGRVYVGAFMCAFMLSWYFVACNTTYHI
jgi:pimeloyl-ACP methyl ester carboxylesterase